MKDRTMQATEWQKKLPMRATYSRIALAPVIFVLCYMSASWAQWAAAALFILASITDYYDGYWARKFKVESNEGRFMDPIADKILVLTALVILLDFKRIDPVMVTLFLSRDILIGGLRSIAATDHIVISAKPTGKWKTAIQMIAIPCLFIYVPVLGLPLREIGYGALWLSVVLSLWSGWEYFSGYRSGRINSQQQKK